MMALLERRLHRGRLPAFLQSLPPLLTMERLLFRIIAAGFVLLTLTLASGMLFSEELFGKPLQLHAQGRVRRSPPGASSPRCWPGADLRLARAHGAALDAGGLPRAGARLHRQQVRARSHPASLAAAPAPLP